jgi:hypothetical protein
MALADALLGRNDLLLVAGRHHDVRASACEGARRLQAEAAVGPGHDGRPAAEIRNVRRTPGHGFLLG